MSGSTKCHDISEIEQTLLHPFRVRIGEEIQLLGSTNLSKRAHEVLLIYTFSSHHLPVLFTYLLHLTYTENGILVQMFVCFVRKFYVTCGGLVTVSRFS